jgi:mannose-6-phosphate isomerase-like protein (cupin superfamily)
MSDYTKINLSEVKDLAPEYGMSEMGQARFARQQLGAETTGLTHYTMNAGRRVGFGHLHREVEETYLVLAGSGRFKVGEDVFDVGPRDVVFVPPGTMREWEAGGDGMEMVAFGGHVEGDAEMKPGWWSDEDS